LFLAVQDERGPRKSKTPKITEINTIAPKNWKPRSKIIIYVDVTWSAIYILSLCLSHTLFPVLFFYRYKKTKQPIRLDFFSFCSYIINKNKVRSCVISTVFRRIHIWDWSANIFDESEAVQVQRSDGGVVESWSKRSAQ